MPRKLIWNYEPLVGVQLQRSLQVESVVLSSAGIVQSLNGLPGKSNGSKDSVDQKKEKKRH